MWITPDTPTLVDLPRGAEVYPDVDMFNWNDVGGNITPMASSGNAPVIVNNDYSELKKEMHGIRSDIGKIMKQQHRDYNNMQYQIYKSNRL